MPPYDALLGVTGPAATPGNPIEAAAITTDADGTKGYVYVGTYKSCVLHTRIAGAFDRTTGNETLAFTVTAATDAAGTGAAVIATGPALTATNAAVVDETSQYGKTTPALSDGPGMVGFMTAAAPWVKVSFDVSGTTPSAASVSADIVVLADAFKRSGT